MPGQCRVVGWSIAGVDSFLDLTELWIIYSIIFFYQNTLVEKKTHRETEDRLSTHCPVRVQSNKQMIELSDFSLNELFCIKCLVVRVILKARIQMGFMALNHLKKIMNEAWIAFKCVSKFAPHFSYYDLDDTLWHSSSLTFLLSNSDMCL